MSTRNKGGLNKDDKLRAELAEKMLQLKIESSLEKVRTTAMKMKKPDDLLNICKALFKELRKLGFQDLRNAMINIYNDDEKTFVNYGYSDETGESINHLRYDSHPVIKRQIRETRKPNEALSEAVFTGKDLADWKRFRKKIGEKDDPRIRKAKALYYYFYSMGSGSIGVSTFGPVKDEKSELLKRFRNVFSLAYQRYTDIALAEAQVRESQIQLALERVRAKTMAMQRSEELAETTYSLFQQLKELGETAGQISIGIIKEKEGIAELSATVHGHQMLQTYRIPLDEPVMMKKVVAARRAKLNSLRIEIRGKELKKYNDWRNSVLERKMKFSEKQWIVNVIFFSKGVLSFSSDKDIPKETLDLLERFAVVFDQTYTRFLDLQKAEAQAREAQIEAALEKVRSRSLAMHHSDELQEVVAVVFEKLKQLGFEMDEAAAMILIFSEGSHGHIQWIADPHQAFPVAFKVRSSNHSMQLDIFNAKEAGIDFFSKVYPFKEKNNYFKYLFATCNDYNRLSDDVKKLLLETKQYGFSVALAKNSAILVTTHKGKLASGGEREILKRFAKVFDQAYTRFLDLKMAEAQAREAQIEAALERVRSRTMAMHQTSELQEVIHTVHSELLNLNLSIVGGSFVVINDDVGTELRCWGAGGTANTSEEVQVPHFNMPFCTNLIKGIKRGPGFFTEEFSQKEKKEYFTKLFKHKPWSELSTEHKKETLSSPGGYTRSVAVSKHTAVFIINHRGVKFTEAENNILKRFAKVFEQTYSRFLDLQKAEAQAREAQIELGLERVRARAMAMQKSEELVDLIDTVQKELTKLEFKLNNCIFWIMDEQPPAATWWVAPVQKTSLPEAYRVFFPKLKYFNAVYKAWRERIPTWTYVLEDEDKRQTDEYIFTQTDLIRFPDKVKKDFATTRRVFISFSFYSYGGLHISTLEPLAQEQLDIIDRFSRVFDMTYTRFLDLKKAEAQAREAQIELGLERVRARAMAMQKSDELSELVDTVFKELTKLDFALTWCIINIIDENSMSNTVWAANPDINKAHESYRMLFEDYPFHHAMMRGWKERRTKYVYVLEGHEKKVYDEYLFNETEFRRVPAAAQAASRAMEKYVVTFSFSNFGGLQTVGDVPLSDANLDILSRFGKVFDLTYTRFNDLLKAEAQAREAKIEAALERVRSRSMGMQKSEELKEVIQIVYEQFVHLDIHVEHTGFIMDYKERDDMSIWLADKHAVPFHVTIPYFDCAHWNSFNVAREKGLDFFANHLDFEEKNRFYQDLFKLIPGVPEETLEYYFSCPGLAISTALSENVGLYIENFSGIPYTDEENVTLMRFGKVFQQTYTRFLDLQKAETQAREAEIELALERVRAKSMAMQRSDQLQGVVETVFERLNELNVELYTAIIIIFSEDSKEIVWWMANRINQPFPKILIRYADNPYLRHLFEAREKGEEIFSKCYFNGEKNDFYDYLFEHTDLRHVPAEQKKFLLQNEFAAMSVAMAKNTGIHITSYSKKSFSDGENEILKRFAKVFDQAYTRFLDLQKAEAQASESQIQLALERVRARTMAMQKSDELQEVVNNVYERLNELKVEMDGAAICSFIEGSKDYYVWIGDYPKPLRIKFNDLTQVQRDYNDVIDRRDELFTKTYSAETKKEYIKFLLEQTVLGVTMPEEQKLLLLSSEFFTTSLACTKNTVFQLYRYTEKSFSNEENDILKRFAKVFEQTYTRFLDLEKAEAQAKESQIQLALERVRARTMAMQRSDELTDAATLLFKQLEDLGVKSWSSGFNIWEMDGRSAKINMCNPDGTMATPYHLPHTEDIFFIRICEARQRGDDLLVMETGGKELEETYNYMFSLPEVKKVLGAMEDTGFQIPKFQVNHCAFFGQGYLMFITYEPVPEMWDVFKRFAKVFEQTYTRFLDLQKAEAQAREAQVEAALERIRSRTMAMQKSDELTDVAGLLFAQVSALGIRTWTAGFNVWSEDNNSYIDYITSPNGGFIEPYTVHTETAEALTDISDARKSGVEFNVLYVEGEKIKQLYRALTKLGEKQFEIMLQDGVRFPSHQYEHFVFGSKVSLMFITYEPVPEAHDIFKRLGKVFEQTYTRFLDLKKAEAQAREAQIEAALERVRSKAMAMHKTEDFHPAVAVVFEELDKLNLGVLRCGISVLNKEKRVGDVFLTSTTEAGSAVQVTGDESFDIHPLLSGAFDAWVRQEDFDYVLEGDDLTHYYKAVKDAKFQLPESQFISAEMGFRRQFVFVAVYHAGGLFAFQEGEFSDEAKKVMKRFANVFDLTYKRFQDLKKAEEQAREATIEAALERVRSKAMAMHKTDDFNPAVATVFEELQKLNLGMSRCGIGIINKETRTANAWLTSITDKGTTVQVSGEESMDIHPLLQGVFNAWLKQEDFSYVLEGADMVNYYRTSGTGNVRLPESQLILSGNELKQQYYHLASFEAGGLFAFRETVFPEEAKAVMKRFAAVFNLTYKRFLDLQKAEAQAREAKIEAAMEKVRARAMAMQKAEELIQVAELLRKEMGSLGVEELETSSIYIHHEDSGTTECWYAIQDVRGADRKLVSDQMTINLNDTWVGREMLKFYNSDETKTSILMRGENRKEWINNCSQHSKVLQGYYGDVIPERTYHLVKFSNGYMGAASPGEISAESWALLKRATSVFSLAFTRFSDLKLAEAQAREATIEAALERVRARAMAMHNTNDLSSATSTAFTELRKLGINPIRFGVGLLSKESRKALLYSATSSAEGDSLALVGWVMLTGHPVLEDIYQSWVKNEDIFPVLSGEQLRSYYEQLLSGLSVPSVPNWERGEKQFGHFFPFSVGCLYAWAEQPFSDADVKILKRFASIIDLTFRRYMDLQKSEANAREAVKQAALDRVRAEIASMRSVSDLDRITPLIWNELTILGIPFIRCGVFIMDETQQLIHTFLSTPDGKAIAAFHLPYDTSSNIAQVVSHWQAKENYIDHWDESAFTEFGAILVRQGALTTAEQYLKTIPHGGFHLHFLPFLQGMLYVGNTAQLGDEQIKLIQSVADAFSTAYARYEDFNRLEAAKQQIERTLVDLRQTQQQLVQAEKMASLGELTAGIAHEIQNPLNFVNNFSEVSSELLEEMKSELATGNGQSAIEIADDVKQNLEKILHHGKRADAIVKGMLQHSRSSTGQKEPTDINALADEYLRLAYHGLRAKDKSFNAKFETDLDATIDKINIVPQEIGRVILNLINNAFYAVTQKRKQLNGTYEPTIVVSTRRINSPLGDGGTKIEIKVKDNGSGIPQRVMDKIFQPFFTTKPTGQGTGLGLSLSYDIITKGHSGELKVETREGEGSEFTIQLPA
jgi:signal transduction histidine kinase